MAKSEVIGSHWAQLCYIKDLTYLPELIVTTQETADYWQQIC